MGRPSVVVAIVIPLLVTLAGPGSSAASVTRPSSTPRPAPATKPAPAAKPAIRHPHLTRRRPSPSCTLPSAPASVSATPGANQATVTWGAASGGPLTAYVVREVTGSEVGDSIATDGNSASAVLTGLSGAAPATFSVAAENSCGTGPIATTSPVTPTGPASTYVGAVLSDAPSAFYRLADPSGPTMADSSGQLADGTYSGQETLGQAAPLPTDPAPSAGYTNCCSGVGDAQPVLPQYDNPRSVEAWINTTDGNGNQALVTWGSGGTDTAFVVSIDRQTVNVDGSNDYLQFVAPRRIADGNWHLVTVTYDGTAVTAYLDGQAVGRSPFTGTLNTVGGALTLGSDPIGGYNVFGGDLADVAVYPSALAAAQVAAHFAASAYGRPSAPVDVRASYGGPNGADISWGYATAPNAALTGYLVTAFQGSHAGDSISVVGDATAAQLTGLAPGSYTFRVVAYDAFGSGVPATSGSLSVTGSATTYLSTVLSDHPSVLYRLADASSALMADASGHAGTGMYDPTDVALGQAAPLASDPATSVGDSTRFDVGDGFPSLPLYSSARTFEAWVQTTTNTMQYLGGYGSSSTSQGFSVYIEPNGQSNVVGLDLYNTGVSFSSPVSMDDGAWHFIAVTDNGTDATAYVDGTAIGTQQLPVGLNTIPGSSGMIVGGAPWNGSTGIDGSLADVAVFPSALTTAQIDAQFAASGYSTPPPPTSPVATAGANRASVSWTAPTGADPQVTAYLVTALAGGTAKAGAVSVGAGATKATLTGLGGGTSYTFEVQALNAYGAGVAATTSAVTVTGPAQTYATTTLADNPSAFYRLDDSTGSVMSDSSGQGATASYNATGVTMGQPAALYNDPAPSLSTSGGGAGHGFPSLPLYAQGRTLEGWFNTTNPNLSYLAGYGSTTNTEAFALAVSSHQVYLAGWNDDLSFFSSETLSDGAWHFVAVTSTGTQATAYVDGISIGTQSFSSPLDTLPSSSGFTVGEAPWGQGLYGDLADVALFPAALTGSQISTQFAASGYLRPSAPRAISASAGANQATVSWTAPARSHPAIVAYLVTALATGTAPANAVSVPAGTTSATVTGLAGGTTYAFKVQALNEYGLGAAATTSSTVTPTGTPSTYVTTVLGDQPSVFYRLTDGSTALMADSSGHGGNGSYVPTTVSLGQPAPLASDPASSVQVNGVAGAGYPALPLYSRARTLEGWIDTTSGGFGYLAGYGSNANTQGFGLAVSPNQVYVAGYDDDLAFTTATRLNDGNWHFVAVTTNGTSATAYVDGRAIGSSKFPTVLDTVGSGMVLGEAPWGQGMSGDLADVAIFPAALSSAQINAQFTASGYSRPSAPGSPAASAGTNQATVSWTPPAPSTPPVTGYLVTALAGGTQAANAVSAGPGATSVTLTGLLGGSSYTFRIQALNAYGAGAAAKTASVTPTGTAATYASTILASLPSVFYRLADGSTVAVADSSGHGATGGYFAGDITLGEAGPVPSDPATAIATNGLAAQGFPVLPSYAHARTLEAWVDTTNGNFGYLAGYGSSNNGQAFAVGVGANQVYIAGYNDDLSFTSPVTLDDGTWHFVAVTFDGTSATAYVDGTAISTQSFTSTLDTLPSSGGFLVGEAPWGQGYTGEIADVAVFPSALTATQITAEYQAGTTAGPLNHPASPPRLRPAPPYVPVDPRGGQR